MEKYFLEHSVQYDRDSDENDVYDDSNSDSEASDHKSMDINQVRTRSVYDPKSPWVQHQMDSSWGKIRHKYSHNKNRYKDSKFTGPKGVRSDYYNYKKQQYEEKLRLQTERQEALHRIATGITIPVHQNQMIASNINANELEDSDSDSDGSEYWNVTSDKHFMQEYTQKRLTEMLSIANSKQMYGKLKYISNDEFLELTKPIMDGNIQDCPDLFVHLYHKENYTCDRMNTYLETIAKELQSVQFTALDITQADESISKSQVPIFLIYKGPERQQTHTLVNLSKVLSGEFTYKRLRVYLQSYLS